MLKHTLLIESGSIGADMVGNRPVCRLADKDANRLPEIVRLTITLFECPWYLRLYSWLLSTIEPPALTSASNNHSLLIFPFQPPAHSLLCLSSIIHCALWQDTRLSQAIHLDFTSYPLAI